MNNTLGKPTCFLPIIFSYLFTCVQVIAGVWNGILDVQPKDFPIVFHIGRIKLTIPFICDFLF